MLRKLRSYVYLGIILVFFAAGWSFFIQQQDKQNVPVTFEQGDLIRLHVIANSDKPEDQQLKLKVRDAIIAYLAPYLEHATNSAAARDIVLAHQSQLTDIAKQVLVINGVNYPVSLQLGIFDFPIKSYGNLILPAGKYQAVRILLGEAQGKNWWCVLFPPLCFIDITNAAAVPVVNVADKQDEGKTPAQTVEFKWKIVEFWNETMQK
ncbi:MAG TPA: stage II sporulation protein R [Negativicutes bacterium]|jgi:stage II sporulation protein R